MDWTSSLAHHRHEVIDVSSSDCDDDKVCKIDAMSVEEDDHLQRKNMQEDDDGTVGSGNGNMQRFSVVEKGKPALAFQEFDERHGEDEAAEMDFRGERQRYAREVEKGKIVFVSQEIDVIDVDEGNPVGSWREDSDPSGLDQDVVVVDEFGSGIGSQKRRFDEMEKGESVLVSQREEETGVDSVTEEDLEASQALHLLSLGVQHVELEQASRPEQDQEASRPEQDQEFGTDAHPQNIARHRRWLTIKELEAREKERRKASSFKVAKRFAKTFATGITEKDEDSTPSLEKSRNLPGNFSESKRRSLFNAAMEWTPKCISGSVQKKKTAPKSLVELCLVLLCKHSESISSLDFVPDELRNRLSQLICDSEKMDSHAMSLFSSGSPRQLCVKNCSLITENQLAEILHRCDLSNMRVLQLDLAGRCITDFIIQVTLARSKNQIKMLESVSLKGAYRLTDLGVKKLVNVAQSLTSINFSKCSLLTPRAIESVTEELGSRLKEIRLDGCSAIDAMSVLPALKKLRCLEVLSVAELSNVSDEFVCQLISACGCRYKVLDFAHCGNLTDNSMEAVGRTCKELSSLNLTGLKKLTDASLAHISNGCCNLQILQLRQAVFSDEEVAAFLQVRGQSLRELSLNGVKQIGYTGDTAIAIANCCSSSLKHLDLSFCTKLTDEAVGLIVDKCLTLSTLKLFGCSQLTSLFYDGHSNLNVKIIGRSQSPILEYLYEVKLLS